MATSIRRTILNAMNTQMSLITTANGYETNLGSNINEMRDLESNPFQDTELPALNYEYTVETADITGSKQEHTISVQAKIKTADSSAVTVLDKAISDVVKNIGATDNFGDTNVELITSIQIDEEGTEHKENKVSEAVLSWQVLYSTDRNNPYTNS